MNEEKGNDASKLSAWRRFLRTIDPAFTVAFLAWVKVVDSYRVDCEYCTNFRSFALGVAVGWLLF